MNHLEIEIFHRAFAAVNATSYEGLGEIFALLLILVFIALSLQFGLFQKEGSTNTNLIPSIKKITTPGSQPKEEVPKMEIMQREAVQETKLEDATLPNALGEIATSITSKLEKDNIDGLTDLERNLNLEVNRLEAEQEAKKKK